MKKRYKILICSGLFATTALLYLINKNPENESLGYERYISKNKSEKNERENKSSQSKIKNVQERKNMSNRNISSVSPGAENIELNLKKLSQAKFAKHEFLNDDLFVFEDGQEFAPIEDFYSVRKEDIDLSQFNIIEDRGYFVVIKSQQAPSVDILEVVKVKGSKKLGIFTGILKVKLNDFELADSMLDQYAHEIEETYPQIGRVFYKFYSYQETMEAFIFLKSHPNVNSVDVEILQYERSSR